MADIFKRLGDKRAIEDGAFLDRRDLTEAIIPDSVTVIGDAAFKGCTELVTVKIPEGVTSIGHEAFKECYGLTEIVIPLGVESVGVEAFHGCERLVIYCEAASEPEGWEMAWNYSWRPVVWDCRRNEIADDGNIYAVIDGLRYALKDGVATVAMQPRALITVKIPSSVTYGARTYGVTGIDYRAFYYCDDLTEVVIPSSVTSIGEEAFKGCDALARINYAGDEAQWDGVSKGRCWDKRSAGYDNTINYTVVYNYRD